MKNSIILILKGIIIGIAKVIPGVSGAMLAISLNVYEEAVRIVSNPFKYKKEIKKILFLGIGIVISIVFFSNVVKYSLENYYLPTMLLFVGLIVGTISEITSNLNKKVTYKNIILFTLSMLVVFGLSIVSKNNGDYNTNFLGLINIGLLDAATTVIPGISGTAVMMIVGCYDGYLTMISDILNHIQPLIIYGISFLIFCLLFAKMMNYLFKKQKQNTYLVIMGFMVSSIIVLFQKTMTTNYSVPELLISLILLVIGYSISKKFNR